MYKRHHVKAFPLIFLLSVLSVPCQAWWNTSWHCRQELSFRNQASDSSLHDFPVLVKLHSGRIDYGLVQNNGEDLRFIDADDSTPLDFEIETWNESGTSYVWVEVTKVDSQTNADSIWMYYNNKGAADGQDTAGTWNAGFEGVWHFGESGTGTRYDATSNSNDGTPTNYDGDEKTTGPVGAADYVDGSNDYISVADAPFDFTDDFTVSAWVKTGAATNDWARIIDKLNRWDFGWGLGGKSGAGYGFVAYWSGGWGGDPAAAFTGINDNSWHYVSAVVEGGVAFTFVDGVRTATYNTRAGQTITTNNNNLLFGKSSSDAAYWSGSLDEVRISSVVRDSHWVYAEHASMIDTFITWSAVEKDEYIPPDNDMTLTATALSETSIALGWNPATVDSADAYQVGIWCKTGDYPDSAGDPTATLVGYYALNVTSDTVLSGLVPNTAYYFIVTVTDSSGNWADTTGAASVTVTTPFKEWYQLDWLSRQQLTFKNQAASVDLTDMPVLVKLATGRIDYTKTKNDGSDLRFVAADNQTLLDYEIEKWNEAGTSYVWVEVPSISAGSNTDYIWMYYNNATAADAADTVGTWSNGYQGVWHLNETGTGTRYDATSNNNDGTPANYDNDESWTGRMAGADSLDGTDDYINIGDVIKSPTQLTVSAWFKVPSLNGTHEAMITKGDNSYALKINNGNNVEFFIYDSNWRTVTSDASPSTGQFVYATGTYDGTNVRLYVNGVLQAGSNTASYINSTTYPLYFGENSQSGGRLFGGIIDEARIAGTARSGSWIYAQHACMIDTFIDWGGASEEGADTLPPDNDSTLTARTLEDGTRRIELTWHPGSTDSADAYIAGIWYGFGAAGGYPDSAYEPGMYLAGLYALTDSIDTLSFDFDAADDTVFFSLLYRDSTGNWSDTAAVACDSAVVFDSLAPDNDMVLSVTTSDDTVFLSWNPALIDSADADSVGIWYKTGDYPDSAGDVTATRLTGFTLTESADTVIMATNDIYYFSLLTRDTSGNWSDTVGSAAAVGTTAADWWDISWNSRMKLKFRGTKLADDTLANAPVLVKLHAGRITYGNCLSGGQDLRFIDGDNRTVLDYEIEQWNTAGTSYVWVRVPEVIGSAGADSCWLYYQNSGAGDGRDTTGVWDGDFNGVYHLHDDLDDHGPAGNDGTNSGSRDSTGYIGEGQYFTAASTEFIQLTASSNFIGAANQPVTIEAWVRASSIGATDYANRIVTIHQGTPGSAVALALGSNDNVQYYHGTTRNFKTLVSTGTWYYLALTYDGTSYRPYLNGQQDTTAITAALSAGSAYTARIGSYDDAQYFFDGFIDEVRISGSARDSSWIAAQYQSMIDSLIDWGGSAPVMLDSIPPDNDSSLTATALGYDNRAVELRWHPGTIDSTDADSVGIWWSAGASGGFPDSATDPGATLLDVYALTDSVDTVRFSSALTGETLYFSLMVRDSAGNWSDTAVLACDSAVVRDTMPPENDLTLSVTLLSDTSVQLVWNPGSIDSADADSVLILYQTGSYPDSARDPGADTADVYALTDSVDTLTGLLADSTYFFSLVIRDSSGNWSDTAGTAKDMARTFRYWWNDGWTGRVCLKFRQAKLADDTLVNAPVLVRLFEPRIDYDDFQKDGTDVRFVDAGHTNLLDFEFEVWDSGGTSFAWVEIPELTGSAGKDSIWMYYGNAGASDGQDTTGTWDGDYLGVYHLHDDLNDHSSAGIDGTNQDSRDSTGRIGEGQYFDAANTEYIDLASGVTYLPGADQPVTIEAWINAASIGAGNYANRIVTIHDGNPSSSIALTAGGNDNIQSYCDAAATQTYSTAITTGSWYYACLTYDGTTMRGYLDGAQDLPDTVTTINAGTAGYLAKIGSYDGTQYSFDGFIDEVRISSIARDSSWIAAQYQSMIDSLIDWDDIAPESPRQAAFTVTNASGDEDVTPVWVRVALSLPSTDTVKAAYEATGGSASGGGTDYTLIADTLRFAPLEMVDSFSVTIVDNGAAEIDETIVIKLTGAVKADRGADSVYIFTILDDDVDGYTGPGGVGDGAINSLWLRASDFSDSTDGDSIGYWPDTSGNGNDFAQATGGLKPVYLEDEINGFAAVDFDGADDLMEDTDGEAYINGLGSFTVFTVTRSDGVGQERAFFDTEASDGADDVFSLRYDDVGASSGGTDDCMKIGLQTSGGTQIMETSGNIQTAQAQMITVHWTSGSDMVLRNNGTDDAPAYLNGTVSGTVSGADRVIIGDGTKDNWDGTVAEVIWYGTKLNGAQMIIVENYLGAKYGITPGTDLYGHAAVHKYDVAGIGHAGGSAFHTNAMSGRRLLLNGATHLDSTEYILFGHDNGADTAWVTADAPASIRRLAREWRFDITDSVGSDGPGTVNLAVDTTGLPARPTGFAGYALLTDANGNFTAGATVYRTAAVGGARYRATGITLSDGGYACIGALITQVAFDTTFMYLNETAASPSLTVKLSYAAVGTVKVPYSVTGGNATGGGIDYTLADDTLVIEPGDTTGSIALILVDDDSLEVDETIEITLSGALNAVMGTDTVLTVTIRDNDRPGYSGPGGIGDDQTNRLWVRAADITGLSDGDSISLWPDTSGNDQDMSQPTAGIKPLYKEDAVNGGPSVDFSVDNARLRKLSFGNMPSTEFSAFLVQKTSGTTDDATISYAVSAANNNALLLFDTQTQRVYIEGGNVTTSVATNDGTWHIMGFTWQNADGALEIYVDGGRDYTNTLQTGVTISGNGCFALGGEQDAVDGGYADNQDFEGEMAEVILYDRVLNGAQKLILFNYLSSCYDITLDTTDMYAFDVIYGKDVSGIGSAGSLGNHLEAQSGGIARIGSPSDLDSAEYLLFGHNGGSIASWTEFGAPANSWRLGARTWRLDCTGSPGSVSVALDTSLLPVKPVAGTQYVVWIDADGNFTSGATRTTLTADGTGYYTGANVAVYDSAYLAFGILKAKVEFAGPASFGSEALTTVKIPVVLSGALSVTAKVAYAVTGGTAVGSGTDYLLEADTVYFAAGTVSETISVSVVNDNDEENDETIEITLSGPVYAVMDNDSVHTYTIMDNDGLGFTGPGGVGDSTSNPLWLKADQFADSSDGAAVGLWTDASGNGNDFVQGTAGSRPLVTLNEINGRPAVDFDGSDDFLEDADGESYVNGLTGFTFYSVHQSDAVNVNAGWFDTEIPDAADDVFGVRYDDAGASGGGDDVIKVGISTGAGAQQLEASENIMTTDVQMIGVHWSSGGNLTLRENGAEDTPTFLGASVGGAINGATHIVAGDGPQGNWDGTLAEIIWYGQQLNRAQFTILENYLGVKYGISVADSRYAFGSTYGSDVAGIGHEGTGHVHFRAQSAGILKIGSPTGFDSTEYVLFGHDGGNVGSWTVTNAPGNSRRIVREWRVDISDSVGTDGPGSLTVTIDTSLLPARPAGFTDYIIVRDSDGDFNNGASVALLDSIGNGRYAATGVALADSDYLAIAVQPYPEANFLMTASSGSESQTSVYLKVVLDAVPVRDVRIPYYVSDASASDEGVDFLLFSDSLEISRGDTIDSILVQVTDDGTPEADEYVTVAISSGAFVTVGDDSLHTYTILDDDVAGWKGPGGVGDSTLIQLWFRAEDLADSSDGDSIGVWPDTSGHNYDARQETAGNRPTYETNELDGHPVVRFNGTTMSMVTDTFNSPLSQPNTVIIITKLADPADNRANLFFDGLTTAGRHNIHKSDLNIWRINGGTNLNGSVASASFHIVAGMFNGVISELIIDGNSDVTGDAGSNPLNGIRLGSVTNGSGAFLDGDIADFVLFGGVLNSCQLVIINNHYAAKYGLSVSDKRYGFDVVYGNDVSGIGHMGGTDFHTAAQSAGIVKIFAATDLDSSEFLLFGHDNASIAGWADTEIIRGKRLTREWRVDITDSTGTDGVGGVSVSIDTSRLPARPNGYGPYVLWTDADGDFSSGALEVDLDSVAPDRYEASGVSLTDGGYFTIGIKRTLVGTLKVSSVNQNPGGSQTWPPDYWSGTPDAGHNNNLLMLRFVAVGETLRLDSLKVRLAGTADTNDIDSVKLYSSSSGSPDTLIPGAYAKFDSSGSKIVAMLAPTAALVIPQNETLKVHILIDAKEGADTSHDARVSIDAVSSIFARGDTSGTGYATTGSFPFQSGDLSLPVELASFTGRAASAGVQLQWRTESETDNAGFHVYRSGSETGTYRRLTPDLIPGAYNSETMSEYEYWDRQVMSGEHYWYKVADVDITGVETMHGPVHVYFEVSGPEAGSDEKHLVLAPNPFRTTLMIGYRGYMPGRAQITVYSVSGREVNRFIVDDLAQNAVYWNGRDRSGKAADPGTYIVELKADGIVERGSVTLGYR